MANEQDQTAAAPQSDLRDEDGAVRTD